MKPDFSRATGLLALAAVTLLGLLEGRAATPNIVYILADDLGYGDLKFLNPESRIATPHMDKLAAEGMVFTDAHSTSSVCTPSRYSILTGRYSWRTRLQQGVPGGFAPPLIDKERLTVPALLKQQGYATACIGKWHLGMTFAKKPDASIPIPDGPVTRGFDRFFGISASLDMPPYAYVRNDRWTSPLDMEKELFKNRPGPAASDFEAVNVLPDLTREAVSFIGEQAAAKKPFFLYLPLTSPHTPLAPTKEWEGKSKLGAYGDFLMQTDATVGQILAALEQGGVAGNTLVILTSDNGFAPMAGNRELEKQGHFPSGPYRGYKADIWEGGHRIPFIARWPGTIRPGTRSGALTSLGDLMATCADITGAKLPDTAGEDSISLLPVLRGESGQPARDSIVHHSNTGRFAIRQGQWKLNFCPGSGGWANPNDPAAVRQGLPAVQLYDLSTDPGEKENLQAEHPEIVTRLTALLEEQIRNGRSTPGEKQKNDAEIVIHKPIVRSEGQK
ncbi:MAG: arylsulfatase [Verrucomicrobiaceae bacterium]|nr:MAG: arylsulfatase [Verrucomicrobiaceae bacterium]